MIKNLFYKTTIKLNDFQTVSFRTCKESPFRYQIYEGPHSTNSKKRLVKQLMYKISCEQNLESDIWLTSVVYLEHCISSLRHLNITLAAIIGLNICEKKYGTKNLPVATYLNYGKQSLSLKNFRDIGQLSQQSSLFSKSCETKFKYSD